jgi:hypothetical protein
LSEVEAGRDPLRRPPATAQTAIVALKPAPA